MLNLQERTATPAALRPSEHKLKLRDGAELAYRAWLPERPTSKALLLFHRGHEHSGRWQETVAALGLDDIAVFAWDQRGHGRSSGDRGSAPDLATVIHDADAWARHLVAEHGIDLRDTIVIAHSLGAVIATAWVHDYAPPIRGLMLATPAFRVKLYVPFALPFLRLRQKLLGPGYVKSFIKAGMLTHDLEEAQRYNADPLIFPQIAINMLLDLHDTSQRLLDDAGAITAPLLVLAAGSDWVVRESAQRRFVERASSPVKRFETLPGFSHALFHEKGRRVVVDKVRGFIKECLARPPAAPLLDADKRGYTHNEHQRLSSPGGLRFAPVRWLMKGPGRLSRGIQLGWKHGYDSGIMLDYIYENQARGVTPLGRLIDRGYLNAIGWLGIRVRRTLLEAALRSIIEQTYAEGRPVRILDIASGPGRYLLETIHKLRTIPIEAVLRDYKQENLDSATRQRDQLGLANVSVAHGDAFDRAALAAITPRPTIAIVSGLYELFPENEPVLRSLRGLADAVEPGGHLLYTNQPWHPQVEFIARVLTNREGRPWIMRRRTQAEMDDLVRTAGFEKVSQEVDPWGIFTVSVARRVALIVRAAITSVCLSLLFVVVYGATNWFTAQRPDSQISTWHFAWEPEFIPFVPLLLIPYMSIDLFFFFAAFLCRDEREMRVLTRRIVFSILVAATFFLLLPLKLVWPERPTMDGWFGFFVEKSVTAPFLMEYPHNLFPAMHITLCAILTDHYARRTRGLVRLFVYFWSLLIVLSTVLTWQHHLVDIAGGFVPAGFAFYFFHESAVRLPVAANVRVGTYYALGAVVVLALAPAVWPWGVFLLWPATGLAIVAAAYFGLGPGIFRKADGRLPWSTQFVLAPVLIGQYLSLIYYRRRCRAWDEVAPGLLIGCTLSEPEATAALEQGVTAVLDLTGELAEAPSFRAANYRSLPILDLTAPTQEQLCEAITFITAEAEAGTVYLHCKIGYSRSAAVAGAYLLASQQCGTVHDAVARLRAARPTIIIRPEVMQALHDFARRHSDAKVLAPLIEIG